MAHTHNINTGNLARAYGLRSRDSRDRPRFLIFTLSGHWLDWFTPLFLVSSAWLVFRHSFAHSLHHHISSLSQHFLSFPHWRNERTKRESESLIWYSPPFTLGFRLPLYLVVVVVEVCARSSISYAEIM